MGVGLGERDAFRLSVACLLLLFCDCLLLFCLLMLSKNCDFFLDMFLFVFAFLSTKLVNQMFCCFFSVFWQVLKCWCGGCVCGFFLLYPCAFCLCMVSQGLCFFPYVVSFVFSIFFNIIVESNFVIVFSCVLAGA